MVLDPTGKIDPDKFDGMMTQVDIQLKTDLAMAQLDSHARNQPAAGKKRTQQEINADQAEKLQMRIGNQILKTLAPNRQMFGESMKNIKGIFAVCVRVLLTSAALLEA
jgi:hypothetical protein